MCLLGLANWQLWFIYLFLTPLLHSLSLFTPVHAMHPVCRLSSISECLFRCEGGPERVAGASETWREDKGYSAQQTVSVSKPFGQMATVCQGDGQSPRLPRANSHTQEHNRNKYAAVIYHATVFHILIKKKNLTHFSNKTKVEHTNALPKCPLIGVATSIEPKLRSKVMKALCQ